jgi:hypothetical protein
MFKPLTRNIAVIISVFSLFVIQSQNNANAMKISEVLTLPFKVITKPIQWWQYGWERKTGEYKTKITYDLKYNNKAIKVSKVIDCTIYEGSFKWQNDGIRRPSRKVVRSVNQVTYEIAETGEILILPIPGYCFVDKPFEEEKTTDKNGKTQVKIIPIPNKTRSFVELKKEVIQSLAIVKFKKENPSEIDYIERIISPKLHFSENVPIKIISTSVEVETKQNPIEEKSVDPNIENRFSWINGDSKSDKLPRWGTYKDEDKGVYSAFGMFKYQKEIWSKVPKLDKFISKVLELEKGNESQEDLIYLSYDNEKYQEIGIKDAIKDAKYYLAGLQSYYSLDRYFGRLGIAGDTEVSILAKTIADGDGIMEVIKGKDIYLGQKWVPKKGKEGEFQEIYKKSNYRDYYHPFTYNEKEKIWEESLGRKGVLMIYRVSNGNQSDIKRTGKFRMFSDCKIKNKIFDKKAEFMIYDKINQELILVPIGDGINLR